MLLRVILGPIRILYVLPTYSMYDVLYGVTASTCDQRYGLTFLIIFLHLKNRLCMHCTVGIINPGHYV